MAEDGPTRTERPGASSRSRSAAAGICSPTTPTSATSVCGSRFVDAPVEMKDGQFLRRLLGGEDRNRLVQVVVAVSERDRRAAVALGGDHFTNSVSLQWRGTRKSTTAGKWRRSLS